MTRGKGVILQRYKSGGQLADVAVFKAEEGLSWTLQGGRRRSEPALDIWRAKRAGAGKNTPRSEERRVGKECVSTCRSRWSPDHSHKKHRHNNNEPTIYIQNTRSTLK